MDFRAPAADLPCQQAKKYNALGKTSFGEPGAWSRCRWPRSLARRRKIEVQLRTVLVQRNASPTDRHLSSVSLAAWLPALWPPGPERPPYASEPHAPALQDVGLLGLDVSEHDTDDPLRRDSKLARLEAALFVADGPLSSRRLGQVANLSDGAEARRLVRRLDELYAAAGSAMFVVEVAGGFQLLTRPEFSSWLNKLYQRGGQVRLSSPAMETLAIVAYRQPVLRAEVEEIRGVECGEMLRQLIEKNLVRIVGRDNSLGRPLLYGTTKKFLMLFGLKDLTELPKVVGLAPPDAPRKKTREDDDENAAISETSSEAE